MSKQIHTSYDFLKTSEIQNAIVQVLSSAPSSPNEGQIYYNSTDQTMYIRLSGSWLDLGQQNTDTLGPDGDKGDITVGGTGTTLTIDNDAVTYAKIQNVVANNVFLGNNSGAGGIVDELTGTEATAMLDLFSTGTTTKGLVPGSNGASTTFLRGDGTWATPAGGFTGFNAGAENGTNQAINDGDLLQFDGIGITTTVSKVSTTVTIDVDIDYLGTDNFIDSATNLEGTAIATGDTIIYHDATDNNVKKGFVSDLPFNNNTYTATLTAGVGIAASAGNYTPSNSTTFNLDFSELTDMTADISGTTEFILQNGTTESRKAASEIKLSAFNVDIASTALSDTANIVYTNAARNIAVTHTVLTGSKLTLVDAPVSDTDAANKLYVDTVAQGLNAKDSVVAATTATGTLATAYENGDTIDGVVLSTNDRILIKNQSTQSENGIYIVQASGAPVRATDANSWTELISAFVFVEEGTTNGDTGWVCTVDDGGTLGATAVTFSQFSGAGSYTAGDGLGLSGTVFSLDAPTGSLDANSTNSVSANSHSHAIATGISDNNIVAIDSSTVATGEYARFTANGLESRTAAEIISELNIPQKYTTTTAATTTTVATHNLGTRNVIVQVYRTATPWDVIDCDIEMDTTNAVSVTFNVAPAAGEYTIVVIG